MQQSTRNKAMPDASIASSPGHVQAFAGGIAVSEAVANQAAEWLTLLMSGEASEDDRQRWQQWRMEHADHERAWQHIETIIGRLKIMEPHAAYKTLSPYTRREGLHSPDRRKAIVMLLWAGAAGASGLLASRTPAWQQMVADYHSDTGTQRTITLDDGTIITLNTASAINVHFSHQQRLVRLVAGEVLITTGHAISDARPFVVETTEGRIRALGTRFAVRQQPDGSSRVAVLESAVEITLEQAPSHRLSAGQSAIFTRDSLTINSLRDSDTAWTKGQIIADQMRLGDFATELSRYRPGLIRCNPAVADLRFSGVFPLEDTDRILATLPSVLPVRILLRTRYWVTIDTVS